MDGGDDVADPLSRAAAEAADAADPLAGFRDRFVADAAGVIYLDGNSLGRLPVATRARLAAAAAEWGDRLVGGWPDWIDAPERTGDALAPADRRRARRGARLRLDHRQPVQARRAAVARRRRARHRPRQLPHRPPRARGDRRPARRSSCGRSTASPTRRRSRAGRATSSSSPTSATAPARSPTCRRSRPPQRERGATLIWDLSHSAGAVPVGLRAAGAELAVGCTYKYLNAGPGAPGYLYVARERQAALRSPIWGWFGQRDQFAMERGYDPEPSIRRFLAGHAADPRPRRRRGGRAARPPRRGIAALHAKAIALTERMIALHDAWLAPLGLHARDAARPGAARLARRARAPRGVAADPRADRPREAWSPTSAGPDAIRLGVAPLYTGHADVWDALDRLRGIAERGEHRAYDATPGRVT